MLIQQLHSKLKTDKSSITFLFIAGEKNIAHVSCVDSWFFSWFFVRFSRLEYTFRHQNGKVLTIVRMTTAATSIDFFLSCPLKSLYDVKKAIDLYISSYIYIRCLMCCYSLACLLRYVTLLFSIEPGECNWRGAQHDIRSNCENQNIYW